MPEKSQSKPLLARRTLLVVNLTLLVLAVWGFVGEYLRQRNAELEIAALEAKAQALEARNLDLASLTARFGTTDALEREARLRLGLQKPGEEVIIIKDLPPLPTAGNPASDAVASAIPVPNSVKWWHYIFGN